jgi:hypothetical protein
MLKKEIKKEIKIDQPRNRWELTAGAWNCLSILILLVALILAGFGKEVLAESNAEKDVETAQKIERILVLPFCDVSALMKDTAHVRGPLSGNVFELDHVDPRGVESMNVFLDAKLQKITSLTTHYASSGITSAVGVLPAAERREARIAVVQQIGQQEQVDAVLCGFIYAFRDRQGGDLSIEKPARVVFELNLVSSANGALIWQKHFEETQKTLTEDLFQIKKFFKRGGRWVTAEQMGRQALDDLFESFPGISSHSDPQ